MSHGNGSEKRYWEERLADMATERRQMLTKISLLQDTIRKLTQDMQQKDKTISQQWQMINELRDVLAVHEQRRAS